VGFFEDIHHLNINKMRIEQLVNNKLATFEQELARHMEECDSFTIGTAFIGGMGIRLLDRFVKRKRPVTSPGQLLTGIYRGFNTQADLLALRQLSVCYPGMIKARIYRPERFHWKSYAFAYKNVVFLYNGSANFTSGGLSTSAEWMTKMTASRSKDKAVIQQWEKTFSAAWDSALSLTEFKVELYKETPRTASLDSFEGLHPELKAQLQLPVDQPTKQPMQRVRMIRVSGYLPMRTAKQVEQFQTEWGRKKWKFFNCNGKADFLAASRATHFVMVWKEARKYYFYFLQKLDESDAFNTPEGGYFIAYQEIGRRKKESGAIKAQLKKMNFRYRSRSFKSQPMGNQQLQQLKEIMGWR
jgi:HKD family nuclease